MGLRRSRISGKRNPFAACRHGCRTQSGSQSAWFSRLPRAQTRRSAFARLYDVA